MLSNAYFLAKFRFDTAENEPAKNLQNFAKFANFADPNPLTLIAQVSLGSACLSAGLLEAADLRGFALPFDYLISSPQMVTWASKGEVTTIAGNFYEMFCFLSFKKSSSELQTLAKLWPHFVTFRQI